MYPLSKSCRWGAWAVLLIAVLTGGCSLFSSQKSPATPNGPTAASRPASSERPLVQRGSESLDPTSAQIQEYIHRFDPKETLASRHGQTPSEAGTNALPDGNGSPISQPEAPALNAVAIRNVAPPPASRPAQAPMPLSPATVGAGPRGTETKSLSMNAIADTGENPDRDVSAPPLSDEPPAPMLAAPRIVSVSVRAAPGGETNKTAPRRYAVNQSSRLDPPPSGDGQAAALERAIAADPNDLEAQFRLRLHYLSTGQDTQAVAATPGMTHENEEVVLAMVRTLQAARSKAGRDPAEWANRQLSAVKELRQIVRERADLRVPRVALCRSVTSYGVYEEFAPAEFAAGRPTAALVYVEAENFRCEHLPSKQYRTQFGIRLAIFDRSGQEVWSRQEGQIQDVSRNIREDFFVPIEIEIPGVLNPGEYTLKASVTDLTGQKSNENQVAFRVVVK